MPEASLNLQNGIEVGGDDPLDRRYEVANNTQRDLLITQQKIKVGRVILHTGDGLHYSLKTYPTPGDLTGVVWEEFGEGGGHTVQDDGVDQTQRAKLNFKGSAVSISDNGVDDSTDITINQADQKFKGKYTSIANLESAHPSAESGDYAHVDLGIGQDVVEYIWDDDDDQWVQSSGATAETGESIATKYESYSDVERFNTTYKNKLDGVQSGATANQTDAHLKNRANHTGTQARNTITNTKGADVNHNASGSLPLNLGGFDHLDVNISDSITSMPISNGIDNNSYEVRLKCSAEVTVKLAPDWLKNTAYVLGDEVVFKNSDNQYVDYQVYECINAHTSDNTGTYGEYVNDLANWQLKVRRPGKNPVKLNSDSDVDVAIITKEGTISGVETYRLEMRYAG